MKTKTDSRGQMGIDTIMIMFILGIMFYIYIVAWEPIRDLLFTALDNYAYGSILILLFQVIPLVLGILIVAVPLAHHQVRRQL